MNLEPEIIINKDGTKSYRYSIQQLEFIRNRDLIKDRLVHPKFSRDTGSYDCGHKVKPKHPHT
jgi:hypothetical protein